MSDSRTSTRRVATPSSVGKERITGSSTSDRRTASRSTESAPIVRSYVTVIGSRWARPRSSSAARARRDTRARDRRDAPDPQDRVPRPALRVHRPHRPLRDERDAAGASGEHRARAPQRPPSFVQPTVCLATRLLVVTEPRASRGSDDRDSLPRRSSVVTHTAGFGSIATSSRPDSTPASSLVETARGSTTSDPRTARFVNGAKLKRRSARSGRRRDQDRRDRAAGAGMRIGRSTALTDTGSQTPAQRGRLRLRAAAVRDRGRDGRSAGGRGRSRASPSRR